MDSQLNLSIIIIKRKMIYKITVSIKQIIFHLKKKPKKQQQLKQTNIATKDSFSQIFIKFCLKGQQIQQDKQSLLLFFTQKQTKNNELKIQKWKFETPKSQFKDLSCQFYIQQQQKNQIKQVEDKPIFKIYAYLQLKSNQSNNNQKSTKTKKIGYVNIDINCFKQGKPNFREEKFLECKDEQATLKYEIFYTKSQFNQKQMVKQLVNLNKLQLLFGQQEKEHFKNSAQFSQIQIQKQYASQQLHQQIGELESIQNYQLFLNNQIRRLKQENQKIKQLQQEKKQLVKTNLQLLNDKIYRKKQLLIKNQQKYQNVKQKIAKIMNIVNQNGGINIVQKVQNMIISNAQPTQYQKL